MLAHNHKMVYKNTRPKIFSIKKIILFRFLHFIFDHKALQIQKDFSVLYSFILYSQ